MNRFLAAFIVFTPGALIVCAAAIVPTEPPSANNVSTVTVEQVRELGLRAGIVQMPQHATITISKPAEVLSFKVGESSLLYQAVGTIEAAVDMSALNEGDVVASESGTTITLPAPSLTSASIDSINSVVLEKKQALLFAPDDKHFQSDAERLAREQFVATACANGILKRSADTAKTSVLSLLSKLNVVNVRVEVREPKECALKENQNV